MNNTNNTVTFKVELANKIRNGRAVGNLWGVGRYINGNRNTWALEPQADKDAAKTFCALALRTELSNLTGPDYETKRMAICDALSKCWAIA